MAIFDITTEQHKITLNKDGTAVVEFRVSNPDAVQKGAKFDIIVGDNTDIKWFEIRNRDNIAIDTDVKIPGNASITIRVAIKNIPADKQKGTYEFKLQVVDAADPRGDHVQSSSVQIIPGKGVPWALIGIIASVVVIVAVIGVVFALKDRPFDAPDLVNKPIEEVRTIVQDMGLIIDENPVIDDKAKPGTVIDQDPKPSDNKELYKGDPMSVDVAQAPPPPTPVPVIPIPNFIGTLLIDAQATAFNQGFAVSVSSYMPTQEHPAGTITNQRPVFAAGGTMPKGTTMFVDVAKAPDQPTPAFKAVPDVRGKTQTEADSIARDSGFKIVVNPVRQLVDKPQLTVFDQNPVPGVPLQIGGNISVTLVEDWIKVPVVTGHSIADAIEICATNGFDLDWKHAVKSPEVAGEEVSLTSYIKRQEPLAGTLLNRRNPPKVVPTVGKKPLLRIDIDKAKLDIQKIRRGGQ